MRKPTPNLSQEGNKSNFSQEGNKFIFFNKKTMKKVNLKILLGALVAMLVLWTGLIVLLAFLGGEKRAENPFKNCQTLADSCVDKSCSYLFLCNETEFSDCQVYDCGDKYGVLIKDKSGKTNSKTVAKPDQAKVQEMIDKCRGSFEVVEKNNCENGEAKAKIKLDAQGDCKIVSATMAIGGKTRIAGVERDGEFYNLSVKSCGEISDIKITGEGGVGIREKVEVLEEDMMNERILPEGFKEEFSKEKLPEAEM